MPPEEPTSPPSRRDALAELAAEAARFAQSRVHDAPEPPPEADTTPGPAAAPQARPRPPRPAAERPRRQTDRVETPAVVESALPGYVPVAVSPERGNTRPAVPVDGRLHLRAAPATVAAIDEIVRAFRERDPAGLRDLERATLIRIGIGIVLADVAAHADRGVVGEAIRAALDPAQRHLDIPMPDPRRWLRDSPTEG